MPKSKKTPKSPITFTTALDGYWLARQRDFSPNTVNDYKRTFAKFATHVGDKPLAAIDTIDINLFLNDLRLTQKLATKTVANAWTALSSFFTWAETELQLPHPIRGKIECPQPAESVIETYTIVEIKALLASCAQTSTWRTRNGRLTTSVRPTAERDKAIIVTLVETGLRASELCNLTLADYNQQQGRLHIRHGKGDKDRLVFISDTCKKHLWRYLATRPDAKPADPLFATNNNTHLDRDMLLKMIRATAATPSSCKRSWVTNAWKPSASTPAWPRSISPLPSAAPPSPTTGACNQKGLPVHTIEWYNIGGCNIDGKGNNKQDALPVSGSASAFKPKRAEWTIHPALFGGRTPPLYQTITPHPCQ